MNIRTILLCLTLGGIPFALTAEPVTREDKILQDLKKQIDQVNVQGFKIVMDVTTSDQSTTTTLLAYAQEKRNILQQQYDALPDNAKEYKSLAKGVGQCYLGICCALGIYAATVTYADALIRNTFSSIYPECKTSLRRLKSLRNSTINSWATFPAAAIEFPIDVCSDHDITGHELRATAAWAIPTLLAGLGAKYLTRFGTQNIKQGWNYKAHLAQQITKLDEIIAYLQNPTSAPAIEEQV